MNDITKILQKIDDGKDPHAQEELLNEVYEELRKIARSKMANERPGHTLQPTILVDDAWLRLCADGKFPHFKNRGHFFATAAKVMRRVLVDHARQRLAIKRRGDLYKTQLSDTEFDQIKSEAPDELLEVVDEVLKEIYEKDEITAKLVELRFFLGLTMEETAEGMGISVSNAERIYNKFKKKYKSKFMELL
jgi:RNA polymerase sigma factor (TIGR02999 family)